MAEDLEFFIEQLKAVRARILPSANKDQNVHYKIIDSLNAVREGILNALPSTEAIRIGKLE
jgi:hypothetical protein